ncbi:hypothetical protein M885DRAFT_620797 [Pelagophyceae sp. CCMP2097]|nr:hypothetical protein M885DRAFT_620797 [Pelagophyceae sp. CCMP2097]|mmetsp:Transcript_10998/g.36750  ORF Transcript_10998/g.36750 Transcript_10998/m.36750 type:complete len:310 (-) Transcript_10998:935-1864(-)
MLRGVLLIAMVGPLRALSHVTAAGRRASLKVALETADARALEAVPRAAAVPDHLWAVRPPTADDLLAVEQHQIKHLTHTVAVPLSTRCKYGYPQAVLTDPTARDQFQGASLLRLTCPHLCEKIDVWEAEGAVKDMSHELFHREDADESHKQDMAKTNARHATTRNALVAGNDAAQRDGQKRFGDGYDLVLSSGLAGLTQIDDLKCVHAQVADELLSGSNVVGQRLLSELERRGVDCGGSDVCREQCGGVPDGWEYLPTKNKQKLWQTRQRRKEQKATTAAVDAEYAAMQGEHVGDAEEKHRAHEPRTKQ